MEFSARHQLRGRITAINLGDVMAEVQVEIANQPLVSVITRASAPRLRLQVCDSVTVITKATEVLLGK